MMRGSAILAWWLLSVATVAVAEPTFAVKPSVTRSGEGATISFTASVETDVEVAVLDDKGNAIRHLVAGRLGANAPAPLATGTLKQTVSWDGKDDLGKAAK